MDAVTLMEAQIQISSLTVDCQGDVINRDQHRCIHLEMVENRAERGEKKNYFINFTDSKFTRCYHNNVY